MGFEDRDYNRYETGNTYDDGYGDTQRGGGGFGSMGDAKQLMVTKIVIVCCVLFVLNLFTQSNENPDGWLLKFSALNSELFAHPWRAYQLLTYGFAHGSFSHVAFNMLSLWMLGRAVEMRTGPREMLAIFLVSVVVSGFVWLLFQLGTSASAIGASGAVCTIVMLFVLYFPQSTVLLFGIIPMKGWVLGCLFIGGQFMGLLSPPGEGPKVAYEAHFAGIAFAVAYYYFGWRLARFVPSREFFEDMKKKRKSRKFKIHDPDEVDPRDEVADKLLTKVHEEGEASLTSKERKILEAYSRRVKERRT